MATIWFAQTNNGSINDANKWKDAPSSGTALTWANLANGDELNLNGKTGIVIPQNVNIDAGVGTSVTVSSRTSGAGASGGRLVSAYDCTLRGNITSGSFEAFVTDTGGARLTVIGNITGGDSDNCAGVWLQNGHSLTATGNVTGGPGTNNTQGIYNECTIAQGGTLVITGNISGGSGAYSSEGVFNLSTRAITIEAGSTITGSATASGFVNDSTANATINATITGGTSTNKYGISNNSTGSLTITGNIIGGSSETTAYAIYNASTGAITITGNVTGGSIAGMPGAIYNASTGAITITGDLQSGNAARTPAVYNVSTGVVTVTGNIINGITGGAAVLGNIRWTPGIGHSEQYGYDATHYYYYAKTIPKADVKLGVDGNGAGAPETGTLVAGAGGGGRLVGNSILIGGI